jgi:dUTP pyrophosphatase
MIANPNLLVKKLDKTAQLPTKGSPLSAGWDVFCIESVDIPSGRQALLNTGLSINVPPGWYARVAPRSGLAVKHGINVHAGIIDADYTGEVRVALINHGDDTVEFRKGDRIAQLILERCGSGALIEVDTLPETQRGAGGLGSTGR